MQNNLQELIDIIDSQVKIEDVISEFIHIEKKGNNYVALCPFHSDSNPSLIISPTKKIFKCFSCGSGGGTIKFVQNYENLNFIEALKRVSTISGINWKDYISEKKIKIDPEKELIKKINLEASNFFKFNLVNLLNTKDENIIKKYINKRNLDNKIITKFKIGYASEHNSLLKFLTKKGYKEEDILKSKLINFRNGKLYDFFRDRIIFPIFNENNEVIAFSGRRLSDNVNFPKYINSQETKLFNKQELFYNLNNAKNKIHLKNQIIIVEGFMDVIAFDRVGLENVVATMGTNFSNYHLKYLSNLTNNVLLSFDNDQAGLKVTVEVGEKLINRNFEVKIIDISDVKDFDEFVKKNNEKEVLKKIKEAIDFIPYMIKKYLSKKDLVEKDILFVLELIKKEKDGIKREKHLNFFEQQATLESIKNLISQKRNEIINTKFINIQAKTKNSNDIISKIEKIKNKIEAEEIKVLSLYFVNKKLINKNNIFFTKKIRLFYDKIYSVVNTNNGNNSNSDLLSIIENELTENELIIFGKIKKIIKFNKKIENNIDLHKEINERKEYISFLIKEYNNLLTRNKINQSNNPEDLKWLMYKVNR